MADQIPFGVVDHILIKSGSLAVQEIRSMYGVPKELTKLCGKLGTIKAVLLDAEEKQQQNNHAVKDWVWRLKGVVYDADDLLDDYATHYLQRGGLARQVSDFFSSENQVAFRLYMSHRLKDIKERIDDIAKDIPMLNLIPRDIVLHTRAENSWRDTHSFVLTSEIVGREENKEEIIGKLLSSDGEENLSVVAIVGIGGLGKTTLAQLVYNDGRVKEHFEPKIWACISDDSGDGFDVNTWIKKVLKSVNVRFEESLEDMKNKLHEKISQKRYLLVLDDVWNQNPQKWDDVRTLLMVGAIGSKIVVTTRKPRVASIMGDNSPISLEGLEQNQSWDLFSKIAFREGQENLHPEILEIGEEIAKMCKGVPLIIKTLAMILQSKREQGEWLSIRNNKNLLSLGEENENVLSVLKLSYDNLPTHLRQCFTYCVVFPKDYEIEKKSLVQLWIAQGYIQSSNDNNEQLEDIGDRYFQELLSRSLLEKAGNNPFTATLRYKMHDLIHDLAQSIIGSEVLILRNDITNISKEIRHVSLFKETNVKIKDIKGKPIRTFIDCCGHWRKDSSAISEVLPSFKSLRVLSVDNLAIEKVSMWVDKLSHLRYLDLSLRDFEAPPNAITRLKNLQTLKLNECWSLKRFPKDTRKLINLRHLENGGCANLTHMPHGIGELTLLQSLPLFVVGEEKELSRVHTIGSLIELKRLNQLRGGLLIKNLQNARVSEGEILKEKECLESLRLEWAQEGNCDVDDELVMKGLQPHRNLKELYIGGYRGERFPSWMMNSLLPNLIKIKIAGCSRCQILPPFSQLPSLQSLDLWNMEEVEGMKEGSSATNAEFFPALQFLKLNRMPKLKGLWRMESGAEQGPSFPHLFKLEIEGCHNLTSFELHSSPSLSTSKIKKCPHLTSFKLQSSPRLSTLKIEECLLLSSFELHSSPCLSEFEISDCPNLTSLGLQSSPSLSKLEIHSCPNLTSLEMPSSLGLSQLQIRDRRNFKSLELQSCSSLAISTIQSYDKLKSLEMPSSLGLSRLEISDRRNLKSLELQSFSSLSILTILSCDELTSLELPSSPHLSRLQISFCCNLKSLELPSSPGLSQLEIEYCDNFTSLELQSAPRLCQVQIRHCQNLTFLKEVSLPSLEKLFLSTVRRVVLIMFVSASSSLESLFINNIDDMVSPPEELLQHLSTLHNLKCSGLATSPHWIGSLTSLSESEISDSPDLTCLELPSSLCLSSLKVNDCPNLTCLKLQPYPCLSSLKIGKCPKFASFEVASLPCLEELSLGGVGAKLLSKLVSIFASSSLKSLYIWEIHDMRSLPKDLLQHLSTLQTLHILKCSRLETLSHWIGSLISLRELGVHECCQLTSLPEEMRSLRNLQELYLCDSLILRIRCSVTTGGNWSRIAHIPHIHFFDDKGIKFKVRNS
ncbi:hypothetical protein VitviT2T_030630 [Vitis vinifera]|uniref:Disease resistance protein RGA3 n=1 Tax=Vitis vinifera TaxID=29760 RepID=A0ABY9E445_VITVI|nr:hypothetical protein VitviT2T_030630 [Vitis vinifera]